VCLVAVAAMLRLGWGQAASGPARPEFDVASLKPHQFAAARGGGRGGVNMTRVTSDPGRITLQAIRAEELIEFAYGFPAERVEGQPSWLYQDSYDIAATTPLATSLADHKLMLQTLLEERLALKVRRSSQEGPVYALVSSKKPKLSPSKDEASFEVSRFKPIPVVHPGGSVDTEYTASPVSLGDLAAWLSSRVGRPVLDKTDMEGFFDIKLSIPSGVLSAPGEPLHSFDGSDFIIPVREQLGSTCNRSVVW
jgi:uncharacterized protein (TIGR03435 family)